MLSAMLRSVQAPGSFHLGRSEGSSPRRVVDSSSREPLSGGSDYESALKGIDSMRIDNNAVNETAASPHQLEEMILLLVKNSKQSSQTD
ncbi:hypothetical protein Bca101_074637 [Brassica carinata]